MKVLSIGNSFSQDAQRYLSRVARAAGVEMQTVNLYIGGCPLERHYRNMLAEDRAYELEFCGMQTGFKTSIKEALLTQPYDVVTVQQASPSSFRPQTYEPFLSELAAYIRKCCPHAKLYFHRTWAYENGSDRLAAMGFASSREMHNAIVKAYEEKVAPLGFDGEIPAGDTMMKLMDGGHTAHRDTFHASFGIGRYAIALTWLKTLAGVSPEGNSFRDFDVPMTEEEILAAQNAAM